MDGECSHSWLEKQVHKDGKRFGVTGGPEWPEMRAA